MAMNENYFGPPVNLDRVCRVCLLEGNNLSPIFSASQDADEFPGLCQKIQVCGSIEIHENDGFPSVICGVCVYKASVAHEFRLQCQQSDSRLRLLYDKPVVSDANESSKQTESQTRLIPDQKAPTPTTYFVKQESQQSANHHDYASPMESYTGTRQQTVVEEHPMDCHEEKLFLCDIDYEAAKQMRDKEAIIMSEVANTANQATEHALPDHAELERQLMTVDMNGRSTAQEATSMRGTQATMVKDDAKPNDTEMEEEYLNEQLLNDDPNVSQVAAHQNVRASADNTVEAKQQSSSSQSHSQPTRTSSRKTKTTTNKSYNEDDQTDDTNDHDYFDNILTNDRRIIKDTTFRCNVCSKNYATEKGLKNHRETHVKNHKCPVCHKPFFKLKNMENHKKIHATKPHACKLCHTSFSKSHTLARHVKTHANDNTNDTNDNVNETNSLNPTVTEDEQQCRKQDAENAQDNEDYETCSDIYKCQDCGQFCSSLKNLKRHVTIHDEKKYSCTVCKKWFFRPDTLKKHAEKHGHGLLDNLADDNKLYDSNDDDDSMGDTVFNNDDHNYDARTKKEDNRRVKEAINEVEGSGTSSQYKCQHCGKIMTTKKGLRRHVSMHKPKAEPVTCEICKKICASQARLALHLKTHNKPKEKIHREYLCHICSKVYPSNSSLTYHMRTHTGIKPHVCKICNSGFTTTTSLANHMRIHTGDKPFVCDVCNAAFAVSSAFRRHLTRHTGEANYLCKTCGKAFKRLSTLKEHTYTHSGEKPYVCKTCGAAYSHSGSLFAHQKRCRVQYGEMVEEHAMAHHIHVSNVQTAVRSLAVIDHTY